jgi:hypothetical protein
VTARPAARRRLNADRLYTAAILLGAMLVPHAILGIVGNWPDKAFNLHLIVVLLLAGGAWKQDIVEAAAAAAADAVRRKGKTKKAYANQTLHTDAARFDAITRQLRDKGGSAA